METRITVLDPCTREIEVTVPAEKVKSALDKSFNELRHQIALPGFRPGKVPRTVLEKKFGDHVRHEVLHDLIKEGIEEAVKEHSLELVSEPAVKGHEEGSVDHKLPAEGPFHFAFTVETRPEFDLPKYKGIEVARRVPPVTEEKVERVLGRIAESRAEWMPADDETWKEGYLVGGILSLEAVGRKVVDAENVSFIVDQPEPVPGVVILDPEALVAGKKAGERAPVKAQINDDYFEPSLRGLEAEGTFEFGDFKRRVVPPVNDDLARQSGFDGLPALRADIQAKLAVEHGHVADKKAVRDVLDGILATADIPLAKGPVERIAKRRVLEMATRIHLQGNVPEEEALKKAMEFRDEFKTAAERDARSWLLIEKIAQRERIFCLEEDVDAEMARIAGESGTTPSKVREYYERKDEMAEVRANILERKTCEWLRDQAKITDEPWIDEPPAASTAGASSSEGGGAAPGEAGESKSMATEEKES